MFRFAYALRTTDEDFDADSLRAADFDAMETDAPRETNVPAVGRRCADLGAALRVVHEGVAWATCQPSGDWRSVAAAINAAPAAVASEAVLLIEPWRDCASPRELWLFHESITRPNVKIAWPAEWGVRTAHPPATVAPVLNLRLGAVRVADEANDTLDFARRLAGIGFGGWLIIDPPASADRLGVARRIADVVRDVVQPRKPAKPVPAKKPA